MITVITPTRNRREWIRRACRSVQLQTFTDWQHVILDVSDDGKTCEDLVPEDDRVKYVRGECRGPALDFQAALELADGEIVTPLSDDDRLPRRALELAHSLIGEAAWLNGRTVLHNTDGDPLHLRGGTHDHVTDTRLGRYMLGGAIYWRKTLTDEIGGFQGEFDSAGDVDLYMRFLKHSDPARTKHVLYLHTVHAGQDSIVNARKQADAARRAAERNA